MPNDDAFKNVEPPQSASMVIHYYLEGRKHSMDAFVRNKAEGEMLALVRYVLVQLNLPVTIETSTYEEGGVIENWLFSLTPTEALVLLGIASTTLFSFVNVIINLMNMDRKGKQLARELTTVSIEEKKLAVEEKKLNLEKMRAELLKAQPDQKVIDAGMLSLAEDLKTITLLSNYFKVLLPYTPVTAVGFGPKKNSDTARLERIVPRESFYRYVITTDKLPTVVHPDALVGIIAPVLDKGSFQWRGRFHGEPITFQLRDAAYRGMVNRGEVTFKHGDAIRCVLNVQRKVDAMGEEVIAGRSVSVVRAKIEGEKVIETVKGRRMAIEEQIARHPQFELGLGLEDPEPEPPLLLE